MPKVSVVMSSYNHARFIGQAINSVLNQSYTDLELVIVENGSTDNSITVIKSFSDPRIKLHELTTNRGGSEGMNTAIEYSTGEYIALLNSDDYFLPDKLSKQIAELESKPHLGAVFGLCRVVDERGAPHPDTFRQTLFKTRWPDHLSYLKYFLFHGNCVCHPTAVIRRSAYDQTGTFDTRLRRLLDFDYWIRLFSRYETQVIDEELAAHRFLDDESNESGMRPEVWAASRWEYFHILYHYLYLDTDLFSRIFTSEIASLELDGLDRLVQLGRIAVSAQHISAQAFGLELLYDAVTLKLPGITAKEVQELSGSLDIYGVTKYYYLETTNVALANELATSRASLHAVYNSKSWKLTQWMRDVMTLIRSYVY